MEQEQSTMQLEIQDVKRNTEEETIAEIQMMRYIASLHPSVVYNPNKYDIAKTMEKLKPLKNEENHD